MNRIKLTGIEKERFERWVIENINERIVPSDEGNGDALIYNIIHLMRGDYDKYNYLPHQNDEIMAYSEYLYGNS